jgi:hypothetical protein
VKVKSVINILSIFSLKSFTIFELNRFINIIHINDLPNISTVLFVFSFLFTDSSSSDIIKISQFTIPKKNVTVVSAEELVYNNLQTNDLAMPSREVLLKL